MSLDNKKLYYLASPYTHQDKKVMEDRYNEVNKFAAHLMKEYKVAPIEPIVMGHAKIQYDMPHEFEYWMEVDFNYISRCDGVIVYKLDGWEKSKGVQAEIEFAKKLGKEVIYFDKI